MGNSRETARFETRPDDGRERWRDGVDREGDEVYAYVHRLAAVAWMDSETWDDQGLDALDGRVIHHDRPIPWLNTQDNLEVHEWADHSNYHLNDVELPDPPVALDAGTITPPSTTGQVSLDQFAAD